MGIPHTDYSESEFCPECGQFVDALNEQTGWCHSCSGTIPLASVTTIFYNLGGRVVRAVWIAKHADTLDELLATGLKIRAAVEVVLKSNPLPKCLCCGAVIKNGNARMLFCRKTPECRRANRRYVYLQRDKNYSKEEALKLTLERLAGNVQE